MARLEMLEWCAGALMLAVTVALTYVLSELTGWSRLWFLYPSVGVGFGFAMAVECLIASRPTWLR